MSEIIPEVQSYSDKLMRMRAVALELKKAVLEAETDRVIMQTKLMSDDGVKIMAMDLGNVERLSFELASCYGRAREIHSIANELGRRLNVKMPLAPTYDEEYADLYASSVLVKLSAPARR